MLINNIDITTYNSKLMGYEFTTNLDYKSKAENSIYCYEKSDINFKTMNVDLLIKGNTRDSVENNYGNLIASLIDTVEISDYGSDRQFFGILSSVEKTYVAVNKIVAKLVFSGEERSVLYAKEFNNFVSANIFNNGNITTKCLSIEITPTVENLEDCKITGLTDVPFTIKNLTKDKTIIIDYNTKTITEDGINKFNDIVNMWEFPRLLPDNNAITISRNSVNLIIKYKERYI